MFPERSTEEIRVCDNLGFVNYYRRYDELTKFDRFRKSLVKMARQFDVG
jgi:hypothetical protein